jgi:hypothetical protein
MSKSLTPAQVLAFKKSKKKKFNKKRVSKAASDIGREGGLKGGPARAEKLSAKQMSLIARHAANIRWNIPCFRNCPYH